MKNFEHLMAGLAASGLSLQRGMLVGETGFATPEQIGVRFVAPNTQIDTYLLVSFFEADKAHPKLGESQKIAGPDGEYIVTAILEQ